MKVLLLNPPSEKGYIRSGRWLKKSRANQSWYPIWLGYSTALLEREGHKCLLIDASVEELDEAETSRKIYFFKPKLIVYYWGYSTYEKDLAFADYLAKYICEVILVGPWWYCLPNALESTKNVHLMTFGEFEHTVLEVAGNKTRDNIKGLIQRIGGKIVKNPPRPLCSSEELDKIPFVTEVYKQHLNIKSYQQTSFKHPFVDLIGARGCPNRCGFCLWIRAFQNGPSYRPRSIKNVIEELWHIKNNIPEVKQIFLQDDSLPENRMKSLSEAIIDENLNITWGGYARAEISYNTLKLFKESGGRTLHVGFESVNQRSLDLINKGITVERMEQFAKDVRKVNFWLCTGFMMFPWETDEEVWNTIMWAKKICKPKRFNIVNVLPYPNTPICQIIEQEKFQGRYRTPEEMSVLEKEAFKEFYLKNPSFWFDVLKNPSEWGKVFRAAIILLKDLWNE